jgi:cell wall-associated NlpC family hydrolase
MTETEERAAVVAEARSWLLTPYVDGARIKGAGADCGTMIQMIFTNLGLIPPYDPGYYAPQHHLHSSEEKYLQHVLKFSREIPGPPLPGDVVMFRFGRTYSHGGIVIGWPRIIHTMRPSGVVIDNVDRCNLGSRSMANLRRRYFSYWA